MKPITPVSLVGENLRTAALGALAYANRDLHTSPAKEQLAERIKARSGYCNRCGSREQISVTPRGAAE